MTTNELLDKMGTAAFGTFFADEIRAIFTRDSEAGKYGTEAKEYNASIRALRKDLSDQKLSLLSEYEELCCKIQDYSAQYGFIAVYIAALSRSLPLTVSMTEALTSTSWKRSHCSQTCSGIQRTTPTLKNEMKFTVKLRTESPKRYRKLWL